MPHARKRLLANAPITEALIDVRVTLARGLTVEDLAGIKVRFSDRFPIVEEQRQSELFLQLAEGRLAPAAVADHGVTGMLLRSDDRREAVQLQDQGFVFSKLRPYTSWEDVSTTARDCWEQYVAAVPVEQVNRIAVRYINHFAVPRQHAVAQYLTAPPAIPEDVESEAVTNTLARLRLMGSDNRVSRVLQATEATELGTSVMLDIDCFRAVQFEPLAATFWSSLEELRQMKNRIFFGSITEFAATEFEK
jgi:uncharacterized protein (TIGR04255 family)